jgi:hypothetical protein
MRYSRGIDRLDRDMLLSAYHPDAIDDHGMFVGRRTNSQTGSWPSTAGRTHGPSTTSSTTIANWTATSPTARPTTSRGSPIRKTGPSTAAGAAT